MKTMTLFSTLLLVVAACTPVPVTPPQPDASDAAAGWDGDVTPPAPVADAAPSPVKDAAPAGDLADQVCAHLASVGCAQPVTCASTIRSKQLPANAGPNTPPGVYTDFKLTQLLAAQSTAAVVAVGTVACLAKK